MAKLIHSAMMSLDAFIADANGKFDWAEPDREVHTFINDLERQCGTYLSGRSMYEVMTIWETDELIKGAPDYMQDFAAVWRAADKVVYSRSLETVSTARTRLARSFDAQALRELKASTERDISIGGPTLATHAFRARLVDECQLFLVPISVGGGTKALPVDLAVKLELGDQRRFACGVVYLKYTVTPSEPPGGRGRSQDTDTDH